MVSTECVLWGCATLISTHISFESEEKHVFFVIDTEAFALELLINFIRIRTRINSLHL